MSTFFRVNTWWAALQRQAVKELTSVKLFDEVEHDEHVPFHSMMEEKFMRNATILIVEDDAILAMNLRRMIRFMGYTVVGPLDSGEKALVFVAENDVDLVLMDIELAGAMNGIAAAGIISQTSDVPIVFLTGFSDDPLLEQARIAAAPYGYLIKPVPERELAATLDMALHRHSLDLALKKSQHALKKSEARFRHLFENSPLGIFRTTLDGKVLAVNAEMARIFGYETAEEVINDFNELPKKSYSDPARRDAFIAQLREKGVVNHFEYQGLKKNGRKTWVSMNAKLTHSDESGQDEQVIDGFAIDITERKLTETYRDISNEVLQILNDSEDFKNALQRVFAVLKNRLGVHAVGIRLQEGEDYPYFVQDGFTPDFLLKENGLLERAADNSLCRDKNGNVKLACICGLVIAGNADTSLPYFTKGGSFWINDLRSLHISSVDDPRHNPRNLCIQYNYASVALVPLRVKDRIVGLIQFNDRRQGYFTQSGVDLSEGIAALIGEALMRKKTKEALRESEEKHRALVKNLPDVVMRFDREGRFLFVSENMRELFGMESEQCMGKHHYELGFPENLCRTWNESIQKVFENGLPLESEIRFERTQGVAIHNWRLVPEKDAHGKVKSVLSLSRDITAHRRAEQNYQTLFHEMLDGFALHQIIYDTDGNPVDYSFVAVNPAFERITGLKASNIIGRTVLEILPNTDPHWIATFGRVASTGEPCHFEHYAVDLQKYFEVSAFQPEVNTFACIFIDVTERKQAEVEKKLLQAQLVQAQKMESIGTLAGGIAHDFNNILGAILGYAEMALDSIPSNFAAAKDINKVLEAGERASNLVKQILAFSRKANSERIPLKPAHIVKEAIKLLRPSLPSTITINQQIDITTQFIFADPTQVHQVMMNLCTNAFHAMEQTGGTLTIKLKDEEFLRENLQNQPEVRPGRFVGLLIGDTGPGIDPLIRDKIFDPYFTTKEVGKGTGMGLAITHGIVASHGGFITCESQRGRGATFQVFFPAFEQEIISEVKQVHAAPSGKERILLVDDEVMLTELNKTMLERLGYEVTVQTSSKDALATFRKQPKHFDAVITDQTMPGMTGMDLARQMLQIQPDIPIILCTGYSTLISEKQAKAEGIRAFVLKPLTKERLALLLREVLNEVKKTEK